MEEARQHTALTRLYWFSAVLLGGSVALLVIAFIVKTPILGSVIVLMMALGLFSRALFFGFLFADQRSAKNPDAKWTAFNAIAMLLFAVGFFVFVVLYHFRAHG